MPWPRDASVRAVPSTSIRVELVSCSHNKMAGNVNYSRIVLLELTRSLFLGSGESEPTLCWPVSRSVPVGAS